MIGKFRIDTAAIILAGYSFGAASLAEKDVLIICGLDDANVTMEEYILPLYNALQNARVRNVQLSAFEDNHAFNQSQEKISQTICDWVKKSY